MELWQTILFIIGLGALFASFVGLAGYFFFLLAQTIINELYAAMRSLKRRPPSGGFLIQDDYPPRQVN